jgi:hypothetical protein
MPAVVTAREPGRQEESPALSGPVRRTRSRRPPGRACRYDFELQRKEQLTAALALPVGVLGVLGSLLAVMVRSFTFQGDPLSVAFGIAVAGAVCSFFACLLQLARAYHRQTYRYLPLLKQLDATLDEWRSFYAETGFTGDEEDFFVRELRARIIDAADRNTENNDARSALLYWARVWLFWLLGLTTAAGTAYVAQQV